MAGYSDRAQPYLDAIAQAAFASTAVRNLLLAGTPHVTDYANARCLDAEQFALRPNTKQPFYCNYWCGKDSRCTCRPEGSKGLESDLMLFMENAKDRRLGLHLEFKAPGERLSFGQAEAYRMRAACWASGRYRPRSVMLHDDWLCVIVCRRVEHPDGELSHFERVIDHAEAATIFPGWPE